MHEEYVKNGMTPVKKRDHKATMKEQESLVDWDELNENPPGTKLMLHKSSNSMNNMLPSVKTALDEAALQSEKRAVESDAEPIKKKTKVEGLKKFLEEQNQSAQMMEMLEKMRVSSNIKYEDIGGMASTIK